MTKYKQFGQLILDTAPSLNHKGARDYIYYINSTVTDVTVYYSGRAFTSAASCAPIAAVNYIDHHIHAATYACGPAYVYLNRMLNINLLESLFKSLVLLTDHGIQGCKQLVCES